LKKAAENELLCHCIACLLGDESMATKFTGEITHMLLMLESLKSVKNALCVIKQASRMHDA